MNDCPSRRNWLDFLMGKVPHDRSDTMARHVENCSQCQEIVRSLNESTDFLIEDLRLGVAEDRYAREPQCGQALLQCERIMGMRQVDRVCQPTVDAGCGFDRTHGDTTPADRIGRYRLGDELGSGHFGTVYRTADPSGEQLAIKVLRQGIHNEAEANDFRARGQRLLDLRHANLVKVYEVNVEGNCPYVVSELVEGTTLKALLQKRGSLSCAEAGRIAAAVADALCHAHASDLVHRDVKPANVLLDSQGNPHLADFDLVATEEELEKEPRNIAGTLAYMSPEQISGLTGWLDGRSDIFSLGVMFYEMLRGKRPFRAESPVELQNEICNRDPRPPRMTNPDIPEALERICLKCLAKRPENRYATAQHLADDLHSWLDRKRVLKRRVALVCLVMLLLGAPAVYGLSLPFFRPSTAIVTDLELYGRRNEDNRRIEGRKLVFDGVDQNAEPLEPLHPNDDFKLTARFSRPTYWYVAWFDTAGVVSIADHSPGKTNTFDYPAGRQFMQVNPGDPEGMHWLALIVGDYPIDSVQLEHHLAELADSANRVEASVFELRGAGSPRESEALLPDAFLKEISGRLPARLAAVQLVPLRTTK